MKFYEGLGEPPPHRLEMEPVPPPTECPSYPESESLGLLKGLHAQHTPTTFRCANCDDMQRPGWMVWVPDSVKKNDPDWSVTEACRANAFNGMGSAWCLRCAKRLGKAKRFPLFASRREPWEEAMRETPEIPKDYSRDLLSGWLLLLAVGLIWVLGMGIAVWRMLS